MRVCLYCRVRLLTWVGCAVSTTSVLCTEYQAHPHEPFPSSQELRTMQTCSVAHKQSSGHQVAHRWKSVWHTCLHTASKS